jgi:hypothetical protein
MKWMLIADSFIFSGLLGGAQSLAGEIPHPTDTMVFTDAGNGGNCNGCSWIAAEGPITTRTPQDFEAFVGKEPYHATTIHLNSNGGDLIAGLVFGEAIRAHKMNTEVGSTVPEPADPQHQAPASGDCYSACAYAFLGGVKRSARTGELGFHQFYTRTTVTEAIKQGDLDRTMATAQQIMGLLVVYLKEMSIDPELLSMASSTDASDIFKPDMDMMDKMGITNERVIFSGWTIEPYRTGAVVTGKLSGAGRGGEDQQITFFCRSNLPGKVFMLASWQYSWVAPGLTTAQQGKQDNDNIRTEIQGSSVTIGENIARRNDGYDSIADAHVDNTDRWFITYVLAADEFAAVLKRGRLVINLDGPHSLGGTWGFEFSPPIADLGKASRIAFKSCL